MKIDKRLSEEFGTNLPPPRWPRWPTVEQATEWLIGSFVPLSVNSALLAIGALVERYFPSAFWWFLGISMTFAFFIMALFALVLAANTIDSSEHDGDYPGS